MGEVSDRLFQHVDDAQAETIGGEEMALALEPFLEEAFFAEYEEQMGDFALFDDARGAWRWAWERIRPGIEAASDLASPRRIADWLGTAIVNSARTAAGDEERGKMWLSRRDDRVRPFHVDADGQVVPWGEPFVVCGGRKMDFPGQPVGDPDCWINCRCVVASEVIRAFTASFAHDLIFLENRRTPKVVKKGERYEPKPSEGKITKRRAATKDEEKVIARGDWLRVNERGDKPGDKRYMDKKSKVRPQNNSLDHTGPEEVAMTATVEEEVIPIEDDEFDTPGIEDELADMEPTPWFGVLAPEGVYSGDGRKFSEGALSWRDLPIPLLWQERSGHGHEGSVVVGQISNIWRDGSLMRASGVFNDTEDADKVVGLIASGDVRGVSVDVDAAEMAMEDEEGQNLLFTKGRICAATVVPIPAFAEAFVSLGRDDSLSSIEEKSEDGEVLAADGSYVNVPIPFVSEEPWDGSASRFTPEQWRKSCVLHVCDGDEKSCHKLPIREPGGALSRAGVHAAAARLNQVDAPPEAIAAAKGHLRGAYKELGEEPPEVLKAAAVTEEFKRGPGWLTNPADTKRIHDYWTKPGNEGYAKIAWGTPGDFRRLRAALAKYVSPRYLNRTAAQWHHDALGYWPGECGKPGNPPCGKRRGLSGETVAASVELVAAALPPLNPEWFLDPGLDGPTPVTVTDDGRIFGHLATWGTCHIGIPGTCVTAPHSASGYAYYRTGTVMSGAGPIPVGQITMDTGHAGLSEGARAAAAHYDHTGTVVADVAAGEDAHGIWIAGALRDSVPAEKVAALRAGALSGDWRSIGGNLELVAALVVNVPGFPVPHTGLAASGGIQSALVAAGLVLPDRGGSTDVEAAVEELVDEVERRVADRAARRARAAALLDDTKSLRVAALLKDMEV